MIATRPMPGAVLALFSQDDHPEASWRLIAEPERRFVEDVVKADFLDPGWLSLEELAALSRDDRRRRQIHLERWHSYRPLVRTRQVTNALMQLASWPDPQPSSTAEQTPVPVITGAPGTGKSKLLNQVAAEAIALAATDRRLLGGGDRDDGSGIRSHQFAVVRLSLPGRVQDKQLFARLCESIGVPSGADAHGSFERAIYRHGIRFVLIDEMQFINFDGQHGRYVHDALKSIQNMGVRLILAGHNIREMLKEQTLATREAARLQSEARWSWIDLSAYPHKTKQDLREWKKLLAAYEGRLRLAGHPEGDRVFTEEFEEYIWVSTLGYANHLSTLLTKASVIASKAPSQRITRDVLDAATIEIRAQKGREARLHLWEAGRFSWSTGFGWQD